MVVLKRMSDMIESIEIPSICYDSSLNIRTRKKPCIIINTRELNIVLGTIYLHIYVRLIACVQLYLTYSKSYTLYIKSICNEHAI